MMKPKEIFGLFLSMFECNKLGLIATYSYNQKINKNERT